MDEYIKELINTFLSFFIGMERIVYYLKTINLLDKVQTIQVAYRWMCGLVTRGWFLYHSKYVNFDQIEHIRERNNDM